MSSCKILRKNEIAYICKQKRLIWVFFGQYFKKLSSYLQSAPSNLWNSKISATISTATILKNYCCISNQHPQISLITKFFEKQEWLRILKNYCPISNLHPQSCLIPKFSEKTRMPKFRTTKTLFQYFWATILKNYCHIWNQ